MLAIKRQGATTLPAALVSGRLFGNNPRDTMVLVMLVFIFTRVACSVPFVFANPLLAELVP